MDIQIKVYMQNVLYAYISSKVFNGLIEENKVVKTKTGRFAVIEDTVITDRDSYTPKVFLWADASIIIIDY